MTKYIAIAVLSLALLVPATSNASRYKFEDSHSGALIPGKAYLGIKAGQLSIDGDLHEDLDPLGLDFPDLATDNLGFVFGGEINEYFSLEFSYTETVSEEKKDLFKLGTDLKVSTDTIGLFLVAKTQGDVYIKGRVGYIRMNQKVSYSLLDFKENDNLYGIAAGLGVGMKIGKGTSLELEYTRFPDTEVFDSCELYFCVFEDDILNELVTIGFVWSFE